MQGKKCEGEGEGVGGRRTVSVRVQEEGEVCVVARGREGEVCVVGQWRPKSAVKKVSMGVWREGEVCMGMEKCVWGECVGGVHVCERKCMYCMSVDLYIHVRIPVFWVL